MPIFSRLNPFTLYPKKKLFPPGLRIQRRGSIVLASILIFHYPSFLAQNVSEQTEQIKMAQILKKSREYCQRLGQVALDFVCMEEVSEKYIDIVQVLEMIRHGMGSRIVEKELVRKHNYLHDYQFIRKDDRKIEKRILLEEDGVKKKEEITQLKTKMFQYKNVLFGPVNLLCEERQPFFDYKMVGDEFFDGERALVIEAIPREEFREQILQGKIWVDNSDFSILKIEWNQDRMAHSAVIKDMARRYKADPRITHITEFGFEKNGIRFPSRYFIEEAYIKKKGKKIIHSETNVIYKDYKFFTVETDVEIKWKK